jgi:AcrR family transcriptional regulator
MVVPSWEVSVADVKHFDAAAALSTVMTLFWRQGFTATGVADVVAATGVNRSSLYATFGGKKELYLAALRRYVDEHALPGFTALAEDDRGLPAIEEFYERLIEKRCAGTYAGFGCLIVKANTGPESADPDVRRLLDQHQEHLVTAMRTALNQAADRCQLRPGLDTASVAEALVLAAYGLNLRSQAGASATDLRRATTGLLASFARQHTYPHSTGKEHTDESA